MNIKEITDDFLIEHNACSVGRMDIGQWIYQQDTRDSAILLKRLIHYNPEWAYWLTVRILNRRNKLAYIIFAAEQALTVESLIIKEECHYIYKKQWDWWWERISIAKDTLVDDVKINEDKIYESVYHSALDIYIQYRVYYAEYNCYALALTERILNHGLELVKKS